MQDGDQVVPQVVGVDATAQVYTYKPRDGLAGALPEVLRDSCSWLGGVVGTSGGISWEVLVL